MCGRIIQASGPLRFAIVEGLNVVDSRYANLPPRYNGAQRQDILVIRQNHETGERSLDPLRWGLIPYWCNDPKDASRLMPRRRPRRRCQPSATRTASVAASCSFEGGKEGPINLLC